MSAKKIALAKLDTPDTDSRSEWDDLHAKIASQVKATALANTNTRLTREALDEALKYLAVDVRLAIMAKLNGSLDAAAYRGADDADPA